MHTKSSPSQPDHAPGWLMEATRKIQRLCKLMQPGPSRLHSNFGPNKVANIFVQDNLLLQARSGSHQQQALLIVVSNLLVVIVPQVFPEGSVRKSHPRLQLLIPKSPHIYKLSEACKQKTNQR